MQLRWFKTEIEWNCIIMMGLEYHALWHFFLIFFGNILKLLQFLQNLPRHEKACGLFWDFFCTFLQFLPIQFTILLIYTCHLCQFVNLQNLFVASLCLFHVSLGYYIHSPWEMHFLSVAWRFLAAEFPTWPFTPRLNLWPYIQPFSGVWQMSPV